MHWRPIAGKDLAAVCRLADEVYPPHLHETDAALRARANMGFGYSHVLEDDRRVVGYVIAHPWDLSIPRLGATPAAIYGHQTVFLHDLAILPAYQRRGLGLEAAHRVQAVAAKSHGSVRLVAVNGSVAFWSACGFRALAEKALGLDSYGPGAVLMQWRPS
jgi:predicted N-acetyltransferase YhbS